MSKSIMQDEAKCLICGTPFGLHRHHVFYGTANRKLSEAYGCWVWLCSRHHNGSMSSVHHNPKMDQTIKRATQEKFEELYSHEKFMSVFGRNWL